MKEVPRTTEGRRKYIDLKNIFYELIVENREVVKPKILPTCFIV